MKFDSFPQNPTPIETPQSRRTSKISGWARKAVLFTAMLGSGLSARAKQTAEKDLLSGQPTTEQKLESNKQVTDQVRTDWDDYINVWLAGKGLKGSPSLDHDNLGKKLLAEYCKLHPGTTLSSDMVKPIQDEIKKYREWVLKRWKESHAMIGDKMFDSKNPEEMARIEKEFMENPSDPDGYPGSKTTSFSFMVALEEYKQKNTIAIPGGLGRVEVERARGDTGVKTEVLGFSKIPDTPDNGQK